MAEPGRVAAHEASSVVPDSTAAIAPGSEAAILPDSEPAPCIESPCEAGMYTRDVQ
jgi:hypothetical protein